MAMTNKNCPLNVELLPEPADESSSSLVLSLSSLSNNSHSDFHPDTVTTNNYCTSTSTTTSATNLGTIYSFSTSTTTTDNNPTFSSSTSTTAATFGLDKLQPFLLSALGNRNHQEEPLPEILDNSNIISGQQHPPRSRFIIIKNIVNFESNTPEGQKRCRYLAPVELLGVDQNRNQSVLVVEPRIVPPPQQNGQSQIVGGGSGGALINISNNSPILSINNNNHLHRSPSSASAASSPASISSVASPTNITSNGHANGIVEEFPSLEELGNTITDNSSFPTNFDLNGFPPVSKLLI